MRLPYSRPAVVESITDPSVFDRLRKSCILNGKLTPGQKRDIGKFRQAESVVWLQAEGAAKRSLATDLKRTSDWSKEERRRNREKRSLEAAGIKNTHRWPAIREAANGVCQCCGEKSTMLICEHNHVTGEIRGATCHSCNNRIGTLETRWGFGLLVTLFGYLADPP